MAESAFLAALRGRPLLLDAGMGTRLMARGLVPGGRESSATWNLSRPDEVLAIHRADVAAGADAIVANTFQASPRVLWAVGEHRRFEEVNRRAVEIAREAAGPGRFVLGSVAPYQAGRGTVEQAALLADLGVDAVLLETWEPEFLARVVVRLREVVRCPLLGSMHRWSADVPETAVAGLGGSFDAFGVNCQPPAEATRLLRSIASRLRSGHPLLIKPSGSGPGQPDEPPAVFSGPVAEWLGMGVRLLGGCCGTTEEHVAAMRRALDAELGRS